MALRKQREERGYSAHLSYHFFIPPRNTIIIAMNAMPSERNLTLNCSFYSLFFVVSFWVRRPHFEKEDHTEIVSKKRGEVSVTLYLLRI